MSEWFERAFNANYLECYSQFEEEAVYQADCDFLVKQLRLTPGERVLDHCCGAGRHSLELARRGHLVTGLDISGSLLAIAQRRAAVESLDISWVECDAREMDFEQVFDAAFNYLTSLGHCCDEDNRLILARLFAALRPGGRLMIEMINTVWLLGNFEPERRVVLEKCTYVEHRRYEAETGRIVTERERIVDGMTEALVPFCVRAYLPCTLIRMLRDVGFELVGLVASPTGGDVDIFNTPRLAFLCQRPE